MTPAVESRIRQAFAQLADAIVAAVEAQLPTGDAPDRLYSVDEARSLLGGISRDRFYRE